MLRIGKVPNAPKLVHVARGNPPDSSLAPESGWPKHVPIALNLTQINILKQNLWSTL